MVTVKRFTASWCNPCKALAPVIESLEPEFPDVKFETVDIDESSELVQQYGIRSVPTIVVEKDGSEVERFVGTHAKQKYVDFLTQIS